MTFSKLIFLNIIILALLSCETDSETATDQVNKSTPSLIDGQKLFAKNCARCHGRGGKGSDKGPPLIHKIYEPSHHSDESFYRAVNKGVQTHHWEFGNMPPIKEVTKPDMMAIIQYIRHQQRKVGIQ